MSERTAPDVVQVERYRPCRNCSGCRNGRPLGYQPEADDCYAIYQENFAAALGIDEPQAQR
jgi:hypothetical protein